MQIVKTKRRTFAIPANAAADLLANLYSLREFGANLRSGADCRGLGRWDALILAVGLLLRGLAALANIDAALEVGAVFDGDAGRGYGAGERAVTPDIHAIASRKVAAHFAKHNDLAGVDVGCHHTITADGDAVARQADRTFHPAINIKRLRSSHLALDHQRFADGRLVGSGSGHRGGRRTRTNCRRRLSGHG